MLLVGCLSLSCVGDRISAQLVLLPAPLAMPRRVAGSPAPAVRASRAFHKECPLLQLHDRVSLIVLLMICVPLSPRQPP
jgi:hypothetical protein